MSVVNNLAEFLSILQRDKPNDSSASPLLKFYGNESSRPKQKELNIDCLSRENSFCLMQLGFDFSSAFNSHIIQLAKYFSQLVDKDEKCTTRRFFEELSRILDLIDSMVDLVDIKDVLPIINFLLDVFSYLPSKFKDIRYNSIIDKICDKNRGVDIIPYEIYVKIWKLDPSYLERDILILINECCQSLPLPSILQDLIHQTYLVRCCNEDYQIFKLVYDIILTILFQSKSNPVFLQFISTFLSSVHHLQQQNQLLSYCIYPEEFQQLRLLLNQDSNTMCLSSLCQQTETIILEINSMVIRENKIKKLNLRLLLSQHIHWYYNITWNIFNSSQKFNSMLAEYLLWFHDVYDDCKSKLVECIKNMKCLLKKKNLKESDIEYGLYNIISIEELQPVTKHLIFLFLLQSDSGYLLSDQLFHMARCDRDNDKLMMLLYLHDIHQINTSDWSHSKLLELYNICQRLRCNLQTHQPIDINHQQQILQKSENLFYLY